MRFSFLSGGAACFAGGALVLACGGGDASGSVTPMDGAGGHAASAGAAGEGGAGGLGGSAGSGGTAGSGGAGGSAGSGGDAGSGGAGGPPATTNIKHVVVVIQENHSFDNYFGRWCTAAPGSNPTCTTGPACCEAAPATEPAGASPVVLDDAENAAYDPNHTQGCELPEANGGLMDKYTTGVSGCSDPRNFAISPDALVKPYHDLATSYALADRYFQPISGQSSSNDMYFAKAGWVFTDNDYKPSTNGQGCTLPAKNGEIRYQNETTIADLLLSAGHSFAFYAMGYHAMIAALLCPVPPSDCTSFTPVINVCNYDPSDVPFEYYGQFADNSKYMKDYADDFASDLASSKLPSVSFLKATGYKNEHPGYGTLISKGIGFVSDVVAAVLGSPYAADTLVLVTWDEGGGYFDHVPPPGVSPVDDQPYGTRVPLLAIGPFAKKNHVSHVTMEHSSVVKFLELNFLGETGQLAARDAVVANIGSLLDPATTGIVVPEN